MDREIYRLQQVCYVRSASLFESAPAFSSQSHNYLSIPKAAFARVVKDIQHVPERCFGIRTPFEALELPEQVQLRRGRPVEMTS